LVTPEQGVLKVRILIRLLGSLTIGCMDIDDLSKSPPSWQPAACWVPAFDRLVQVSKVAVERELAKWDEELAELGGDPARVDWSRFRPLRLQSEGEALAWRAWAIAFLGAVEQRLLGFPHRIRAQRAGGRRSEISSGSSFFVL
jgi:hypothetical protein